MKGALIERWWQWRSVQTRQTALWIALEWKIELPRGRRVAENPNNDQLQLDSLCHSANVLNAPLQNSMSPAAREEQRILYSNIDG